MHSKNEPLLLLVLLLVLPRADSAAAVAAGDGDCFATSAFAATRRQPAVQAMDA